MDDKNPIQHPYPYSLRVIGHASEDFERIVLGIFDKHGTQIERSEFRMRHSRAGNYVSLRIQFTLESRSQLQAIYAELKDSEHVVMIL